MAARQQREHQRTARASSSPRDTDLSTISQTELNNVARLITSARAGPSGGKHPKKPCPKNSRPSDQTLHLKLESKQMLHATRPDTVDIIIPPAGHARAIETVLAHGAWAIICQKSFCAEFDQARSMTAQAQAAGIPRIVHKNFRFQP